MRPSAGVEPPPSERSRPGRSGTLASLERPGGHDQVPRRDGLAGVGRRRPCGGLVAPGGSDQVGSNEMSSYMSSRPSDLLHVLEDLGAGERNGGSTSIPGRGRGDRRRCRTGSGCRTWPPGSDSNTRSHRRRNPFPAHGSEDLASRSLCSWYMPAKPAPITSESTSRSARFVAELAAGASWRVIGDTFQGCCDNGHGREPATAVSVIRRNFRADRLVGEHPAVHPTRSGAAAGGCCPTAVHAPSALSS